jgi:hypothetical protein
MRGSQHIHFSELFTDTVRAHGVQWAAGYYAKNGMSTKEFRLWLKANWSAIKGA